MLSQGALPGQSCSGIQTPGAATMRCGGHSGFCNGVSNPLRPVQVGQLSLRLWASFLNNSSSRWEAAWEAWPLRVEMVDRVSAIYRSDHQRCAPTAMMGAWRTLLACVQPHRPFLDDNVVK